MSAKIEFRIEERHAAGGNPAAARMIPRIATPLSAFGVFWAAFLLFQSEPLLGKYLLPWFGGSPTVWTTCMLFFQVMLLAGYGYAHLSLARLGAAHQAAIHAVLLLASVCMLPITPPADWRPDDGANPIVTILAVLLGSVGLPFLVLSTTSPLLQAWYVRLCPGRSPYPLYALSNLGSLVALLSYPLFFEPYFTLGEQMRGWSLGFVVIALCLLALIALFWRQSLRHAIGARPGNGDSDSPGIAGELRPGLRWGLWLGLPAAASALLLATTNQLCQDVASIPFLWIVPLALYLLSFITAFAHRFGYVRLVFVPLQILGVFGMVTVLYSGPTLDLAWQVMLYAFGMFSCCMTCHGELYRLRPDPEHLTGYYLGIAAGGALGSLFVSVLAPLLFSMYFEFHIALLASCGLPLYSLYLDHRARYRPWVQRWVSAGIAIAMLLLAVRLTHHAWATAGGKLWVNRDFYGVLRVENRDSGDPAQARRVLRHGSIDHGFQFLAPGRRRWPTAYYGPSSGIGRVLNRPGVGLGRRIGLVGLGTGTLLAYARPEDTVLIYEINPNVVDVAERFFSFIGDSPATVERVVADARMALEREPDRHFDVLVLDAFSGDAIPLHLLTREALAIYRRHLRPDGILAINISNHHLDLGPVIRGLAEQAGLDYRIVWNGPTGDGGNYGSFWALMSRNARRLAGLAPEDSDDHRLIHPTRSMVWTDDYSNLYRVLK